MKILNIRDASISIGSGIANAYVSFEEMTVSAVVIETDVVRDGRRVLGFGFTSNGRYSASGILRARMIPRLLKASGKELVDSSGSNFDPFRMWQTMMRNEKPGGHGERSTAVGALDMAIWDLVAKIEEKPLYKLLGERFGNACADPIVPRVNVYAAGGYYREGGLIELRQEMQSYLDLGYTEVKMKVGGAPLAEDLRRIEAVLEVVGVGSRLAVDANGRFDTATALSFDKAISSYGLKWYEEPGDPLDFELLRTIAREYITPLATGENLFSVQDTRNLLRYGGLSPETSFLQMDPALSYGLVEYLKMLDVLREHNWSRRRCVPHGGHQMNLHIAAGLGLGGVESYPGIFQPFGGFGDGERIENGGIRLSDAPGIGIENKASLYKLFQALTAGEVPKYTL